MDHVEFLHLLPDVALPEGHVDHRPTLLTFKDCGADGWLKKAKEELATLS